MGAVKVVTWNIQYGNDVDGAIDALSGRDRLAGADALLLQEMDEKGTSAVASALGYHSVYAAASVHPRTGREFGNAVLSPWPLVASQVIELPHKARLAGQPRIGLMAVARLESTDIALCATHTETAMLGPSRRREQFTVLGQVASKWTTEQVVIGGDFNTVTSRGIRALVTRFDDLGFRHVSLDAVTTQRRTGQGFTLDHIFARGFTPIESGVVRDIDVSDHSPVWVELLALDQQHPRSPG